MKALLGETFMGIKSMRRCAAALLLGVHACALLKRYFISSRGKSCGCWMAQAQLSAGRPGRFAGR
jgi:hypothetical protein